MEELYKLIPDEYAEAISSRLSVGRLSEIRLRNRSPVRVCYDGAYFYLCKNGISKVREDAFVAGEKAAEEVILRACDKSIYTVTETLKRGFVSAPGGIRLGVCGSGVFSDGTLFAVKDYSSVNIRIPHEVKGCATALAGKMFEDGAPVSTLIVSPPGAGKTTVLRDLCRIVSCRGLNVMLCDEKNELASVRGGVSTLDVGENTDIFSGTDKRRVFDIAIAYMRPDVIMTDELLGSDISAVEEAGYSGVAVVATAHARDLGELFSKPGYGGIRDKKLFSRYAVISRPPRREISVFDANGGEMR